MVGQLPEATVPGFLVNFAGFTASAVMFGENIVNSVTALQTPDGLSAETVSAVKGAVKGLGGECSLFNYCENYF